MKIIHCSDVHLDSKLDGVNSLERNNELLSTFGKTVDYAKSQDVRLFIIAGDLFDTSRVSQKTKNFIIDLITQTPELDFLYLKGNHDNLNPFDGEIMPPNFKPFFNEWTQYTYDDVTITGIETDDANCVRLYDQLSLDPTKQNIVVMHGAVSSALDSQSVNIDLLKNKNIDYLALGHYHSYLAKPLDLRGIYCYSGCLEGRGYDEAGEKGFVIIETDPKIKHKLLTGFSHRTIYEIDVDISSLDTYLKIKNAVLSAVSQIDKRHYVKIRLTGSYNLNTQKDINHLNLDLSSMFYSVKIEDNTTLAINSEEYMYDVSLKGEFIRNVLKSDLSEKQKEDIINIGIKALRGEEIVL
jgi:DNA repair exonuclease SbcCD nuclease subunit